MKKRVIAIVLALCLTVASAFALVGCAGGGDSSAEAVNGILSSYDNFYNNAEDVIKNGMIVSGKANMSTSSEVDWAYTPEGATEEIKVTYKNVSTEKESVEYQCKLINGVLNMTVKINSEHDSVYYETYDADKSAPITPMLSKRKFSETWTMGSDSGRTFFAKYTCVTQEGEDELGEEEVTKKYITFADQVAYDEAMSSLMTYLDDRYISSPYAMFSSSSIETMLIMGSFMKIGVEDGVSVVRVNAAMPMIDVDEKETQCMLADMVVKYAKVGPKSYSSVMEQRSGDDIMKTDIDLNYSYKSSLKAQTEVSFDGFTHDETLDVLDAGYMIGDFMA